MKTRGITLLLLLIPFLLPAQGEVTIARRMKILVADLESAAPAGSLMEGKTLAGELEKGIRESRVFLEKTLIVPRETTGKETAGFRIDDMLGLLKKGQQMEVEALLAGKVTKEDGGLYTILVQMIDVQKKNIPSTRRVLNFAEVRGVPDKADGALAAVKKLIETLETGNFPRVDIITPNFDVVSINQINKDNFPEMKLSISVVNSRGEPVALPPDLFEVRENGNMVLAAVERSKASESVHTPITLLLAIDKSPSMLEELNGRKTGMPFKRAKSAALEFISRLSPHDRVKVVAFDQQVSELGGYTNDKQYYTDRLNRVNVGVATGLYNVLKYCVRDMEGIKGEKAVILLTDGRNDVRGAPPEVAAVTLEEGLDLAQNLSIPVYTIGFGGADEKVLGRIASETHSIFFKAISSEKLRELYMKLHKIIENQYIITYKSLADRTGKVNVSLNIKEDERLFYLSPEELKKVEELKKDKILEQEMGRLSLQKKELENTRQAVEKEKTVLEAGKKDLKIIQDDLDKKRMELEKEKEALGKLQAAYENDRKGLSENQGRLEQNRKETEQKAAELSRLKSDLEGKEKNMAVLEKNLAAKEMEVRTREEKIRIENGKIEEQKKEILRIQENIRKANREILDFLKAKFEYINAENEKLERMKNVQSESNP